MNQELDLSTPGKYDDAVVVKVSDSSGNEKEEKITVTVYNGDSSFLLYSTAPFRRPVSYSTVTSTVMLLSFPAKSATVRRAEQME